MYNFIYIYYCKCTKMLWKFSVFLCMYTQKWTYQFMSLKSTNLGYVHFFVYIHGIFHVHVQKNSTFFVHAQFFLYIRKQLNFYHQKLSDWTSNSDVWMGFTVRFCNGSGPKHWCICWTNDLVPDWWQLTKYSNVTNVTEIVS